MDRLQATEELGGEVARAPSEDQICAVVLDDGQQRIFAFRLYTLLSGRVMGVVGEHLSEQAVSKTEREIAERGQRAHLQSGSAKTMAPAMMISARRGPMPGCARRSTRLRLASPEFFATAA